MGLILPTTHSDHAPVDCSDHHTGTQQRRGHPNSFLPRVASAAPDDWHPTNHCDCCAGTSSGCSHVWCAVFNDPPGVTRHATLLHYITRNLVLRTVVGSHISPNLICVFCRSNRLLHLNSHCWRASTTPLRPLSQVRFLLFLSCWSGVISFFV